MDADRCLNLESSVNDSLHLSGQSLSEECTTLHDISICTPPHRPTLAEQLVGVPEDELETLFDQVLERRPELRAKLGEGKKKIVKQIPTVETVSWDLNLIDNREMYRDDRGGWVNAATAKSERYKTVGWDFRGLPIVHIGRGRPKTKMISLLQQDPTKPVSSNFIEGESHSTLAHDLLCSSQPTSDGVSSEPKAVGYSMEKPRTSVRLQKKKAYREINTKPEGEADSPDTEVGTESTTTAAVGSLDDQGMKAATELEGSFDYEVPTDVVSEVSISTRNRHRYSCVDCSLVFKSMFLYRKHTSLPDCVGFSERCYMCQARIGDRHLLFVHEHGQCYLDVGQPLPAQVDLEEWASSRYTCGLCGKGASTEEVLLAHAKSSHPSLPIFKCRLCENAYHELRPLCNHFNKHHTARVRFACNLCEKTLTSERSLTTHMKYAHTDMQILTCPLCDKQLKSRKAFDHHMSCIHENRKPFKCQYCEKAFVTKSTLDLHTKAHRGIRDHMCEICGATFLQKVRLTEHVRAHTGVKDFQCLTCSKFFYTLKDLNGHKKIHASQKTYVCVACGKAFAQSQTLKKHMLKHNESVLSFKCQFCVKSFKSSATVYKHCRLVHRDKLTAFCSFCSLWFVSKADLNRHNHYKHIWMYDGRAEEKTFLSSTAELTEDLYTDLNPPASALIDDAVTSYECVCGLTFPGVNELALHVQTTHPDRELSVTMATDNVIYDQPKSLEASNTEEVEDMTQSPPHTANACEMAELDSGSMELVTETGVSYSQEEVVSLTPPLEACQEQHGIPPLEAKLVSNLHRYGDVTSLHITPVSLSSSLTPGESRGKVYQLSTAATGLTEIHQVFGSHHQ